MILSSVPAAAAPASPASPAAPAASQRAPAHGHAHWRVGLADGCSAALGVSASYPLSLLVPRARDTACWGFLASHGGGLVSGDRVTITAEVLGGARAYLGSQSTGKVYRALDGGWSTQEVRLRVAAGALLVFAPDPLSCFRHARYRQSLRYDLAPGASLVACDALLAGREARGERWSFDHLESATDIALDGQVQASDRSCLRGERLARGLAGVGALMTCFTAGPLVAPLVIQGQALLPEAVPGTALVASCAPCAGGHLWRVAAATSADLAAFCQRLFAPLGELLGGQPWLRRP